MKKQKGITLIALVITIIVLLILAGVSISMVLGDNGVLSQADKSKRETEIASEKEVIELAYSALNSDVIIGNSEKVVAADLEEEIEKLYNKGDVTVTAGSTILTVKFELSQREYILDNKGNILNSMPMEEILATATKHPDQTLTGDIGIAEDGTQVNLDLWTYTLDSSNTYSMGNCYTSAYNNDNIVDGKIQGKIPMYIKEEGGEFQKVTYISFSGCTNLVEAPEIPSSVTGLAYTFYGCTNLVIAPELPSSITSLFWSFYGCTNLVEAPEIPSSVTGLAYTFYGCTSLVEVPAIPNSVTEMSGTFYGCTNLVEAPEIPSSVTGLAYTFYGCTSLVEVPAIPDSVTNMYRTFAGCTNLINPPEIPVNVTWMKGTFYDCTNLTGELKINNTISSSSKYANFLTNAATAEGCNLVLVGNGENDDFVNKIYSAVSSNTNITLQSNT